MEVMNVLVDVLKHRPNARVLILEALPQDAAMLADHILAHPPQRGISAGPDHRDQVLVMALAHYSQNKRRMGPVDVVIVHQRYNMHRIDTDKRYKGLLRYFDTVAMVKPRFIFMEPDPILGMERKHASPWTCGQPYPTKTRTMGLVAVGAEWAPCGAENNSGVWFCRQCGTFRGLIYRGF